MILHQHIQHRAVIAALGIVATILIVLTFDDFTSSFLGSLTTIGTKGGRTITQITFDAGEISETLPVNNLNIVLTPDAADISHGARLSDAISSGKYVYGYKYTSRNATAEIAAKAQAENGAPLTFSELFPGQFFASEEARNDGNFIRDFERQKNISFLSLSAVTLERNARYVLVTEDEGTTLTIGGLLGFCGMGMFSSKADYPSMHEPIALSLADVNGDTLMDIIEVGAGERTATLFGNANGTFAPAIEGRIGFYSNYFRDFAFGDLNGDDRADIVATNGSETFISMGRGDGTFDEPTYFEGAHIENEILIADIDNDGDNDVITGSSSNNLTVFRNNGIGNFSQSQSYTSPPLGWLASIDIDVDGDLDIVANSSDNGLVFLNNGDGTFPLFQMYGGGVYKQSFAIADFNGDHALDIYSLLGGSRSPEARKGILFGNGDGTFGTHDEIGVTVNTNTSLVTADFNGDGMADIAHAVEESHTLSISLGSNNRILNRVTQLFDTGNSYTTGLVPRFLAVGDFNGDSAFDLVTSNYGSDTVSVFLAISRENAFCPAGL